ncbi:MAG TPA: filamentous hemagglutinin N-terminal domain-containing protein, partial [Oscillatoriaceae cyanobacterium M33_DOE_052]|nr:filamentous hemagglutinin N-terminal domain-containing protein [Oscillatoriaceae cyanobacterium M33_DOE_052]
MSKLANQGNSHSHAVVPKDGVFSKISWLTLALGGSFLLTPEIATSQPITPETGANGTGTIITTPDGQQFDINGGARSGDGANLFHSFQQFGLNQGQTANFISNPQIQNILGRVVGGDPSVINGLIQITGGSSNLFLMNPAGIVFGPNASLNIPADFTATTASGIGFGNNQWFNNFGSNDYINLVGIPSAFSFNMSQLGTIINEGNLTITPGSNLNLFANTVINTGTLTTPGGNINITAVPNGNTLRISQPGHILSLEIIPTGNNHQSLPQLLTGGDPIHHATTVFKQPDGTIRLSGSQTPIPLEPGVAVVSGNVDVGGLKPNYELNILGDKIALIGANIDASGTNGAGNIHIGGNYQGAGPLPNATHTYIDSNTNISANAINSGNGGEIIIWSDNTTQFHGHISATGIENGGFVEVSGKQNLIFRGNVDLSATSGNTGTLLLDPENIYIVDGAVAPDDAEIADEQILWDDPFGSPYGTDYTISEQALESLNGNANVELQATNDIVIDDLADNELAFQSGAGVINIAADYDNDGFGSFVMSPGDRITALGRTLYISAANIVTGSIDTGNTGNALFYTSWGSIQPADATTQVTANWAVFQAANGSIGTPNQPVEINANNLEATVGAGGAFFNSPNSGVTLGGITANPLSIAIYGGVFSLTAAGDIIANSGQSISTDGNWSGNIILTSTNGGINISGGGFGTWDTTYLYVDSGEISLTAANDISINDIALYSYSFTGDSGDITITSNTGGINLTNSDVYSYSDVGNSGNITIQADGDINIPDSNFIKTYAISGNSGNIDVNSANGGIDITNIESISDSQDAGIIKLEASGDINTSSIYSYGISQGGAIEIISHAGDINTSDGQIESFAQMGNTGNITITSHSGAFNLINGEIDSYAEGGDAGNITIQADGDINTPDPSFISTYSISGNSGNIDINSTNGSISIGYTGSISEGQNAGSVKVQAANDINTLSIESYGITQGGDIEIISHTGNINTSDGQIQSLTEAGNGGNITIKADGNINITDATTTYSVSGNSGNIDINSTNGSISIGETRSVADGLEGQDAGNIKLEAAGDINGLGIYSYGISQGGDIEIISHTGNINNINGYIESFAETGNTGNITITSHSGEVNLINSQIDVFTEEGNSGNVTIQADGDINLPVPTFINTASTNGKGGDIDINSTNGNIIIGQLYSFSQNQDAGSVKLEAAGDINTLSIFANGNNNGGNIEIISHTGNINTSNSTIDSLAKTGNAGHITITSHNGTFNLINGKIQSFTDTGNAGDVTITTDGDINMPDPTFINSYSINGNGGNIEINSSSGSINIGIVQSFSENQNAGSVKLEAAGDINTSSIYAEGLANGGDIEIISEMGNINTSGEKIASFTDTGNGGSVTIKADGDINIPAPTFISAYSIGGNGGDIDINSTSGSINIGNVEAISRTQDGGSVKLEAAGDINTSNISAAALGDGGDIDIISYGGNIDTSNGTITSFTGSTTAGDIHIQAAGNITTAQIDAYAEPIDSNTTTGDGGNITINSTGGTINTSASAIQSYAFYGNAGDVNIEAAGDITTNYITSASLSPNATHQGGDINIISYNGGINTTGGNLSFLVEIADTAAIADIANTFLNNFANISPFATNGFGGDINLQAKNDIITSHLSSYAGAGSGDVNITTSDGNINTGVIFSVSPQGSGGNITIKAPEGDITTSHINSYATQNGTGGFVDITGGGDFNIGAATINSFSGQNTAGDVTINVGGNINLGGDANRSAIRSEGPIGGGNISITSTTGEIDASLGRLDSYSQEATAGNVTLNAAENITTAGILSDGKQVGGNITITSSGGSVDTSRENLESYSLEGTAGNVTIEAPGDITTEDIFSDGWQIGGNITITSTQGQIEATGGNLYSFSEGGKAGNVTLDAPGDITTLEIYSDGYEVGGNISITSRNGTIDASGGSLYSFSANGEAGNVTLAAPGNITTSEIYSDGLEQGGNIEITTGGNLDLSAATLNSYSENGTAGNVSLSAQRNVTLGGDAENSAIRSEGLQQGGNISITSVSGEINSRQGNLDSFSEAGTAGNVFLRANGNVNTASIRSEGAKQGGSIVILSFEGNVDTWGNLNSFSSNGTAGDLAIQAEGNINTFGIRSDGYVQGGLVRLISSNGAINTSWGTLDSYSIGGTAGSVLLEALGSITTGAIRSEGLRQGGSISISSYRDTINTTAGNLQSFSPAGTAGNVSLNAPEKITTGSIISYGRSVGGNISINSGSEEGIDTTAGVLETYSTDGNAGNVTLTAPGDIVTGGGGDWEGDGSGCLVVGAPCLPPRALGANGEVAPGADGTFESGGQFTNLGSGIRSQGWLRGGKIEIISDGNINTSLGNLDSYSENGIAGDVTIDAGGSITASNITSYGNFQSGNVGIFSQDGAIRTGTLRTISPNGTSGNVTLNTFSHQGDIITADITSEGGLAAGNITAKAPDGAITTGDLTSRSVEGDAGDITVAAGGDVETGDIRSLGGGNSGDIAVTSTGGNVTTGDIESRAETGSAGDITVAAFGDVNTGTITSSGATGDGNISVTSVTGTVNGGDVSVQPQPVQSESAPNQPPVVNPAPANSSVATITNNNPVISPEMNIPAAPVNLPAPDLVTRIVSEGGNVSNINNSVVLRAESNSNSGGDSSGEISLSSGSADVAKTISVLSSSPLAVATSDAAVAALDKNRESEFEAYFGGNLGQNLTSTASTREAMLKIAEETGYKSAIIYVMAQPEQLELIVMTGTGQPIRKTVPEAPREKLLEVVSQFRSQLTATRLGKRTDGYRKPAEQLYQWLIAPIESELQAAGINTLLLSMDAGLRSLPMAALYDGQQFLVEKYSMSQIPSISLVD